MNWQGLIMINNKKIPQLRFRGFTDDWETKTLGDVGTVAMNKRIFKYQTSDTGEIPFYKIGTFGKEADSFITRELFQEYKNKYSYPKVGNILISASGSIGKTVEYKGKDEYFQDSNIVWLNHNDDIEDSFLKQFYTFVKWSGLEGSTIKRLYNKNILETEIYTPYLQEQEKIGNFFQKLDTLIELRQQELIKLKNIKKAMLSKLFPQNGSLTPQLRFRGFTDDWETKTLGEIFQYERPDPYIVKNDTYSDLNKTPVLTANKAFILGYTNETRTYHSTSIIFDDFTLDNKYVDFPYMVKSSAIKILTIKDPLKDSLLFAYELLNLTKIEIMGHARHYISVVQPTKVYSTHIKEQEKIGNFFQKLDTLIELRQQELIKLKNIKKAYLDKMFI